MEIHELAEGIPIPGCGDKLYLISAERGTFLKNDDVITLSVGEERRIKCGWFTLKKKRAGEGVATVGVEEIPPCEVCGAASYGSCCDGGYYCGDECQDFDWEHECMAVGARRRRKGRRKKRRKYPSAAKARKILREGEIRGRPLTAKQKRFFGWIAGGRKPRSRRRKK